MRFGVGAGERGVVVLPDARHRASARACSTTASSSRTPSSATWRSAAATPSGARRRPPGSGAACRGRPGRPTSTSTSHAIDQLFWPNLIILGGGVSKNADKFIPRLTVRPRVVPATLRNDAGIIGAAMVAAERDAGVRRPEAPRLAERLTAGRGVPSGHEPRPPAARRCAARGPSDHDHRAARRRMTTATETPTCTAQMVIGGESVDAADGQTFDVVNPATGAVIATAPLGGREDVDRAVAAAQAAFEDRKGWANWAAGKRGRIAGQARRPDQGAHRGARPAREPQRRQADHAAPAARSSARASSSTTTPAPRTRSSARRSRSRSPAST